MSGAPRPGRPARCSMRDGFVAAAFRHRTSRAGDPHLHTHVVIANLAHSPSDGRWTALDGRPLYSWLSPVGHLYEAQLRWELTRRLGVEWGPVRNGIADIAGIPQTAMREFSTRRREIEAHLDEARPAQRPRRAARRRTPPDDRRTPAPLPRACCRSGERAPTPAGSMRTRSPQVVGQATMIEPPRPDQRGGRRAVSLAGERGGADRASAARSVNATSSRRCATRSHTAGMSTRSSTSSTGSWSRSMSSRYAPGHDRGHDPTPRRDSGRRPGPTRAAGPRRRCSRLEARLVDTALTGQASHVRCRRAGAIEDAIIERTGDDDRRAGRMVRAICSSGDRDRDRRGRRRCRQDLRARRRARGVGGVRLPRHRLLARGPRREATRTRCRYPGLDDRSAPRSPRPRPTERHSTPPPCWSSTKPPWSAPASSPVCSITRRPRARRSCLVGDPCQLPEIDAGGAFRGLRARLGASDLTENRRQTAPWERSALGRAPRR